MSVIGRLTDEFDHIESFIVDRDISQCREEHYSKSKQKTNLNLMIYNNIVTFILFNKKMYKNQGVKMCAFFVNGVGYSYDVEWVYLGNCSKKLFKRDGMTAEQITTKLEEK